MKKFERVNLEDVLRADAEGMPIFRKCFEHETLMSFYDDSGNKYFKEWWEEIGSALFNNYYNNEMEKAEEEYRELLNRANEKKWIED